MQYLTGRVNPFSQMLRSGARRGILVMTNTVGPVSWLLRDDQHDHLLLPPDRTGGRLKDIVEQIRLSLEKSLLSVLKTENKQIFFRPFVKLHLTFYRISLSTNYEPTLFIQLLTPKLCSWTMWCLKVY